MDIMYKIYFILAVAIASGLILYPAISATAQAPTEQNITGQQANVPLSFFLKLKDDSKNATSSGNQSSQAKNATITVTLEKGPGGSPVKLPVSAMVPGGTEAKDLELCASLQGGKEVCQPLDKKDGKIDLSSGGQTNQSSSNMSSTPTAYAPHSGFLGQAKNIFDSISSPLQSANAQLITVDDTTLNIPITVIIPITLQIQNAQICASVASSGDQTCTQLVINPTQTGYTPVDINLSTGATPTISTGTTEPISTSIGGTGSNETTTAPDSTSNTTSASTSGSSEPSTSNDTSSSGTSDTEQQQEDNSGSNNDEPTQNGDSTSQTD
jgi:hypothetical protein